MKLKRYIEFIKESLKEDIESGKIYELSEDQIREYLIELDDAGYYISVDFGFVDDKMGRIHGTYTEKAKSGEKIRPAYWIQIQSVSSVNNEDLTDALHFANSIISDEANADVVIFDDGGSLDIDTILIKGGLFINTEPGDGHSGEEAEVYIALFVKQKDVVEITEVDLAEYYNWGSYEEKDGKIYVEVDIEDMSDIMLSRSSNYKDILVKGEENMYDNYYNNYYQPDIQSMFQYTLTKENEQLLIKAMIKEVGGLEQTINHIGDECSDEAYESVKGKSEEEVIEFLLKERFYDTLKQLCKNSEICQEIRQTIGDWEMNAHVDSNYQSILNEFDEIVEKEFSYTKEDKEITRYYKSKDAEGNETKREYKEMLTYYTIPYSNDWIEEEDAERLKGNSLFDIFKEWCGEQYFTYEMEPHFSDYGDVDSKALNQDLKSDLERYLSK